MARYHKVKTSLPYYIPIFTPLPFPFKIGSLGAVIRLRETPSSTRKFFDIGITGPLAGFVVSVGLLIYGFATLPPAEEYIYSVHDMYRTEFHHVPTELELKHYAEEKQMSSSGIKLGSNLLYDFLSRTIPSDRAQVPPPYEMMHYPFLLAGFLTLFFTAMNLLPIGQLDGGHVIYGLLGKKRAHVVSRFAVIGLLVIGGSGFMNFSGLAGSEVVEGGFFVQLSARLQMLGDSSQRLLGVPIFGFFVWYVLRKVFKTWRSGKVIALTVSLLALQALACACWPSIEVNGIWLLYSFLAVRVLGVEHPGAQHEEPLSAGRKILGVLAIVIFIISFSPAPLLFF
jgi:membrane-associated protease RseP (regulator of RpoE activity)